VADQKHPARDIVKSPRFQFANVDINGNPGKDNAMKVTVTGLGQIGGSQSVFLQTRNIDNAAAPDVFDLHLLHPGPDDVTSDRIIFRIKRLDESGGWGQRLRIQIMIVSM
jgi:hypothetical protein